MAIIKRTEVDRREILIDGTIQVRTATVIEEDGVELSRSFHRHVIHPGQNVSNEDDTVKAVAAVEHTPEKIAAYAAKLEARQN